jgi:hypothetical protein
VGSNPTLSARNMFGCSINRNLSENMKTPGRTCLSGRLAGKWAVRAWFTHSADIRWPG